jgi:hypothetical protein
MAGVIQASTSPADQARRIQEPAAPAATATPPGPGNRVEHDFYLDSVPVDQKSRFACRGVFPGV